MPGSVVANIKRAGRKIDTFLKEDEDLSRMQHETMW